MQNINSDLIRGNIDTIILKTMLNGDMYGLDIIREVQNKSNGTYELKQPTLYSCLKRLENQELISSYWLDSDIGGKRHYYKLTEKGRNVIKSKQNEWSKSKLLIDNLLGDFDNSEYRLVKKDDYDKIINGTPKIVYIQTPATNINQDSLDEQNNDKTTENAENITTISANNDGGDDIEFSKDESSSLENQEDPNFECDDFEPNENFQNTQENKETKVVTTTEINLANINNESNYENILTIENTQIEPIKIETNNQIVSEITKSENQYDEIVSQMDLKNIKLESNPNPFDNEIIILPKKNSDNDIFVNNQNTNSNNESNLNNLNANFNGSDIISANINLWSNFNHIEKPIQKSPQTNSFVQQNIFENVLMPYQNEVDDKISEFNKNISKLNNFDYSGLENTDSEELSKTNMQTNHISENTEIKENFNKINNQNDTKISVSSNISLSASSDNSGVEGTLPDFLELSEETSNEESFTQNFNNSPNNQNEFTQENFGETQDFDEGVDQNLYSVSSFNDGLNELNKLSNNDYVSFDNDDGYDSLFEYPNSNNENENNPKNEAQQFEENSKSPNNEKELIYEEINNDDTTKFNKDALEEIIYKSASDYTNDNSRDYYSNLIVTYPENVDQDYKDKVQGLSAYTKNSIIASNEIKSAKDIQTLKEEYKNEGITIKEFSKSKAPTTAKNYLMVNKLNLIKSFILMFGYIFVLSALYIVMSNTKFKDITGFSFKYFLYGFIPFIIYTVYNLVMYLINPYKKVPAKFSPRMMMFISIIFTIQLLLITYCLNLQLGFYSFTQIGYNHLLWLVPGLVCFAPIVSTLIYGGLYRSKNFII